MADSKALTLGSTVETLLIFYQQPDEKIHLLLLLRVGDSHPSLCTCPCRVLGQHRGRTTAHLPHIGSGSTSWPSLPSTLTGVVLYLHSPPERPQVPQGVFTPRRGSRLDKQRCCRKEDTAKDSGSKGCAPHTGEDIWAEGPGLDLTSIPLPLGSLTTLENGTYML